MVLKFASELKRGRCCSINIVHIGCCGNGAVQFDRADYVRCGDQGLFTSAKRAKSRAVYRLITLKMCYLVIFENYGLLEAHVLLVLASAFFNAIHHDVLGL
mmetsp:Transcript_12585/g.16167  ORF Transcript_12585/g.16167 Transcript_12585/m.16167 type:complete len:101 (+) Transcript_12585:186-488(+)